MSSIRISDSWLPEKRIRTLRSFPRKRDSLSAGRFAALAVRIVFGLVLSALLYSIAIAEESRVESKIEPGATSRTLQSLASIRAAAEEYVRANSDANATNISALLVTATELDARLQLTQCANELSAFTLNSAPITARTTVGVRCSSQSHGQSPGQSSGHSPDAKSPGAEWTVYVPVAIESEIDVLVLRNSMPKDAHLAAGDLSPERRRVPGFGAAYISNAALLRDQHLKRGVPAGAVLMADMLMRDLVVKRGQHVMLVFDVGGLAVHAPGLALADGGTADRIRVQNQTSLKVVEGVIESGNLIRVGM